MACEPFDAAALTEDAATRCATRLGFDLSLQGELEYLLTAESVDVQAAPGSGKTSLTGVKLCMLSSVWTNKRQGICVLSHTNTAKDQIRSILERDDAGRVLLSHPHFVGTIQTFVDTFLALPYLRSHRIEIRSIDDDIYAAAACIAWRSRRDLQSLRGSLGTRWNGEDLIGCACVKYENGDICVCPETDNWPYGSAARSTKDYKRLKELMTSEGRFRYQDMFAYAQAQLDENPYIAGVLRERFPVVIIDEMQDTSQLQQMLLSMIFPPEKCIVQRIGDENQRIYNSGLSSPDESFPAKDHMTLGHTRRFGPNIARTASQLTIKTPQTITATGDVNRPGYLGGSIP